MSGQICRAICEWNRGHQVLLSVSRRIFLLSLRQQYGLHRATGSIGYAVWFTDFHETLKHPFLQLVRRRYGVECGTFYARWLDIKREVGSFGKRIKRDNWGLDHD